MECSNTVPSVSSRLHELVCISLYVWIYRYRLDTELEPEIVIPPIVLKSTVNQSNKGLPEVLLRTLQLSLMEKTKDFFYV